MINNQIHAVTGAYGYSGRYKLQPIYVDDLAALAVDQAEKRDNVIIDAIGPETFAYRSLVQEIGRIIGKNRPNTLGYEYTSELARRIDRTVRYESK